MSILYRISNIYSFHILAYNICIFHMSFNFNLLYSDFFIIHITIYYTIHLYVFTIQYTIHLYVSYYSLIRILLFIYMYFTIHFIRILLFIYTYFTIYLYIFYYSPLTIHYSLFTIYHLPFTIQYLPFTINYLLFR